jgi:hypothetical protein
MPMIDHPPGQFEELQRRIREVAYLMWEAAGAQHGRALEFWLAAEREVLRSFEPAPQHDNAAEPLPPAGPEAADAPPSPPAGGPRRDQP